MCDDTFTCLRVWSRMYVYVLMWASFHDEKKVLTVCLSGPAAETTERAVWVTMSKSR